MTPEQRKQAEEIFEKNIADLRADLRKTGNKVPLKYGFFYNRIIDAMESYASLRLAEAEKRIAFETVYQLEEWRKVECQHFDANGNAYEAQNMSVSVREQMLRLINQLDGELALKGQSADSDENVILNKMNSMCIESLPPEKFREWEEVMEFLRLVRKNLSGKDINVPTKDKRMPTDEEIRNQAEVKFVNEIHQAIWISGCNWFRSRMKGENK